MSRLTVFNFIILNGFFKGPNEDISWNKHDAEENEYSIRMLDPGNILLFGRMTYEMMASYWQALIAWGRLNDSDPLPLPIY